MAKIFEILDEHQAVVIRLDGDISASEMVDMRVRTMEIVKETGIHHFIVDISGLRSLEKGSTFATFELGTSFRPTGFPLRAKTAVIMPTTPAARKQAEFLHTVEINRGRGEIKYVDSIDDALYWFRASAD